MSQFRMPKPEQYGVRSAGFLLTQIGAHVADQFAERLKPLHLQPAHAGILRMLARNPGLSQQDLARRLGMHASRLVAVIDEMEEKRFVQRKPSPDDRRVYALHLTSEGLEQLQRIGEVARTHQRELLSPLNEQERLLLTELLTRIANNEKLTEGVHPGYARQPPK
jgi:DNA-binding MarR family transcriptional regulator